MRSRPGLLALAGYMTPAVLACTSRPPANNANSPTTTDSNNPNPSAANADAANDTGSPARSTKGSGKSGAMSKAAAPAPLVIPAGTPGSAFTGHRDPSVPAESAVSFGPESSLQVEPEFPGF